MNGRSKREYDGTYILSPFDTIIGGRVGNRDSHAADLSQDVESTSFASGYRAKVAGYRSRVGQESVYGFRLLSGHSTLTLGGVEIGRVLAANTSKLQTVASQIRFLLGNHDLLCVAQDFQPNIHIDDIHYDLSWPRQQQGDL